MIVCALCWGVKVDAKSKGIAKGTIFTAEK